VVLELVELYLFITVDHLAVDGTISTLGLLKDEFCHQSRKLTTMLVILA
jgi:hypothetical protein